MFDENYIPFIEALHNMDMETIKKKFILLSIFWAFVSISVVVDLISGVSKAFRLGETRTSIILRKTIKKVNQYAAFLLFACLFDIILGFWFQPPYVTILTSLFLIFIEFFSVYENLDNSDKNKYKNKVKNLYDIYKSLNTEDKEQIKDWLKNNKIKE